MEGVHLPMSYNYSKFLFYSSFSMLISTLIAIYMNDIYITIYFLLLFLSSINYWRKPEYGIRRNIDLLIVKIGVIIVLSQICLLKNEFCRYIYASLAFCSLLFYIIEHILVYMNNVKWIIFHMSIHLYMSLSALFVIFN
jgi:hypothetical protein